MRLKTVIVLLILRGCVAFAQQTLITPAKLVRGVSGANTTYLQSNPSGAVSWSQIAYSDIIGAPNLSIPNTRIAFGTGTGLTSDANLTYASSILNTSRIAIGTGSQANPSLYFQGATAGLWYQSGGVGITSHNSSSSLVLDNSSGLTFSSNGNPSLTLNSGNGTGSFNNINFAGAWANGSTALGGNNIYATIDGFGGMFFKTVPNVSTAFVKAGVGVNDNFSYLRFGNNNIGSAYSPSSGSIGTFTAWHAMYNNTNFITGTNKAINTQNEWLGGLIIGNYINNTAIIGEAPAATINAQYKGTDGSLNQSFYDIVFHINTNRAGTYSFHQPVERLRIKDNGNLLLNSVMEIQAPTTPLTNADDGAVISYEYSTNVFKPKILTKSTFGLGNVDNTSDANKPISTATQTALNGKANASHTHAQSDITNLVSDLAAKASTSYVDAQNTSQNTTINLKLNITDYKSIYNSDGTLAANRTITANDKNLIVANTTGVFQFGTSNPNYSNFSIYNQTAGRSALSVLGVSGASFTVDGYGGTNANVSAANRTEFTTSSGTEYARIDNSGIALAGSTRTVSGLKTSGATGSEAISVTQGNLQYGGTVTSAGTQSGSAWTQTFSTSSYRDFARQDLTGSPTSVTLTLAGGIANGEYVLGLYNVPSTTNITFSTNVKNINGSTFSFFGTSSGFMRFYFIYDGTNYYLMNYSANPNGS